MRVVVTRLLIALTVLAAAGVGVFLYANSKNAPQQFDIDSIAKKNKSAASSKQDPGLRPEPGTYVYTGGGKESVSTLGGNTRKLPGSIAVTVELIGKDCEWSMKTMYLKQHVTTNKFCTDADGTRLLHATDTLSFYGVTSGSAFACPNVKPASQLVTCKPDEGDRVKLERTETRSPASKGGERLVASSKYLGYPSGEEVTTENLLATGLPTSFERTVRILSNTPFGEARYRMDASYRLQSKDPQ